MIRLNMALLVRPIPVRPRQAAVASPSRSSTGTENKTTQVAQPLFHQQTQPQICASTTASCDAAVSNTKPRRVHFNVEAPQVVLIPTKEEFINAGIAPYIWQTAIDYNTFQMHVHNELSTYIQIITPLCAALCTQRIEFATFIETYQEEMRFLYNQSLETRECMLPALLHLYEEQKTRYTETHQALTASHLEYRQEYACFQRLEYMCTALPDDSRIQLQYHTCKSRVEQLSLQIRNQEGELEKLQAEIEECNRQIHQLHTDVENADILRHTPLNIERYVKDPARTLMKMLYQPSYTPSVDNSPSTIAATFSSSASPDQPNYTAAAAST